MKTILRHGAVLDVATPTEVADLLTALRRVDTATRIRASAVIALDGQGSGADEVFLVPLGYEFELRRVFLDLDIVNGLPSAGAAVPIQAGGRAVEYLRSGARIEYAQPQYAGNYQVPGMQTWGAEQGPYFRNGEVFEVRVSQLGVTPMRLGVYAEGIMSKPEQEAR